MSKIIVRAVDSGNIQRSPTFQAIFNYTLVNTADFPLGIEFSSAGMDVDKIMENKTPALKKLSISRSIAFETDALTLFSAAMC